MPNWVDNTLVIFVPIKKAGEFRAAISGPADWFYPIDALPEFERPKNELSQHKMLEITGQGEDLIARFKDYHADKGWPDWMKPGPLDLAAFLEDPDYRKQYNETAPFSVVRLRPWDGPEEFAEFFPESDSKSPLWSGMTGHGKIMEMRRRFLGTKWPPGHIVMDEIEMGTHTQFKITYQTPWGAIEDLAEILTPTLEAHDAKALLTWIEEQGFCGYEYIDPSREIVHTDSFDADRFINTVEDEDGDEIIEFDHEGFVDLVQGVIDDPDLG